MRSIKTYKFINNIHTICREYDISDYTINPDGSIDVDGNVDLYGKRLTKLPFKFGKVSGEFNCSCNNLTSLEGSPTHVGGKYFSCSNNNLTSLEGCPHISNDFYCYSNKLIRFEGCPRLGGQFDCGDNPVFKIYELFNDPSKIELFNDYDIIRGNSVNPEIVLDRLNEFLEVIGKPVVSKVFGYKNI